MTETKDKETGQRGKGGFEGILKGLTNLVGKLADLAETGEQLRRTGEIHFGEKEKDIKGIYGFSIKVGLGGEEIKVEPFGNLRENEATGHPFVHEVREPMVDVFEEEDCILIVAEMPGIEADDLKVDLKEDILTIQGERGDKKYRKEILLPGVFPREKMELSCKNGIVEIRFPK